jgi:hypothetical protein
MSKLAAIGLAGLLALAGAAASSPQSSKTAESSAAREAARSYRLVAARHIYARFPERIHAGALPPMLKAVVVVETTVDARGRVAREQFLRVPAHARESGTQVRKLILQAAPYPALPGRTGTVRFTEVWLLEPKGQFQLQSLSEGQRSE